MSPRAQTEGSATPRSSDPETAGVKVPPPLIYVFGLVAGAALEWGFPVDRPDTWVALAGILLAVAGWLATDGAAMLVFRRAGTSMIPFNPSTALVTTGPYRFTRNPMYLGMVFLYVGLALAIGLVWPLVLLPLVILAVDRLVIAREEPYLERRFGSAYRDYKGSVRRWL